MDTITPYQITMTTTVTTTRTTITPTTTINATLTTIPKDGLLGVGE